MYESARSALKAGIIVGCFFITGFPEDDYRSVLKAYGAIIKCAWVGFNAYSPQLNTESYKELQKTGVITEFDEPVYVSGFWSKKNFLQS